MLCDGWKQVWGEEVVFAESRRKEKNCDPKQRKERNKIVKERKIQVRILERKKLYRFGIDVSSVVWKFEGLKLLYLTFVRMYGAWSWKEWSLGPTQWYLALCFWSYKECGAC